MPFDMVPPKEKAKDINYYKNVSCVCGVLFGQIRRGRLYVATGLIETSHLGWGLPVLGVRLCVGIAGHWGGLHGRERVGVGITGHWGELRGHESGCGHHRALGRAQ